MIAQARRRHLVASATGRPAPMVAGGFVASNAMTYASPVQSLETLHCAFDAAVGSAGPATMRSCTDCDGSGVAGLVPIGKTRLSSSAPATSDLSRRPGSCRSRPAGSRGGCDCPWRSAHGDGRDYYVQLRRHGRAAAASVSRKGERVDDARDEDCRRRRARYSRAAGSRGGYRSGGDHRWRRRSLRRRSGPRTARGTRSSADPDPQCAADRAALQRQAPKAPRGGTPRCSPSTRSNAGRSTG